MCDMQEHRAPGLGAITRGLSPPRQYAGRGRGYPPPDPTFKSYAQQKAERDAADKGGEPGTRIDTAGRATKFNPPQGKKMVHGGAQASSNADTACFYYGAPPEKGRQHALKQVDMKGSGATNVIVPNSKKDSFNSEYMGNFPKGSGPQAAKAHASKQPAFGKVPQGGFIKWDRHDAHNMDEIPVKDEKFYMITGGSGQDQYGHYFVHRKDKGKGHSGAAKKRLEGDPENDRSVRKQVDFSEHPALGTAVLRAHMTTLDFAQFPGQNEWMEQKPVRATSNAGTEIKDRNVKSQIEWDLHG